MNEGPGRYNAGRGAPLLSANLSTGGPKLGWPAPVRAVVRLFLLAEGFARAAVLGWMAWTGTDIPEVHPWGWASLAWIAAMVLAEWRWGFGNPGLPTVREKSSLALHYLAVAILAFLALHGLTLADLIPRGPLGFLLREGNIDHYTPAHLHLLFHAIALLVYGRFILVMDHRAKLEF